MKLIEANQKLLALKQPIIETADAAACLKITITHASQILNRLAKSKVVLKLMKGKWALSDKIDPLILPEYLTTPMPSYVSLQTALFHHGMISQIPSVIYAVSLVRSARYKTPFGTISTHHINSEFFFGFDFVPKTLIKMACPEKALLDIFYLSPSRSHLFKALPEIELPRNFSFKKMQDWTKRVQSKRRQTIMLKLIKDLRERVSSS